MSSGDERPLLDVTDTSVSAKDIGEKKQNYGCAPCNPFHWSHRFFFLAAVCSLCFGNYFVYDNPAALQNQFQRDMSISTSDFMLMYSLYSWPNVFLCFVGGFLMDRILGLRWGGMIFAAFVLAGQCVCALGAWINSYPTILAGRFIFGLGGENLAVAQSAYAVSWFKGRELNMVFGLQLSLSRVGSTVNMNIMKPMYDTFGHGDGGHVALSYTLWIGALLCFASLLCAVLAAWMDKRASRILGRDAGQVGEVIQLSDIKSFPLSFWLICIICVAYYVVVFPFIGLALVFFQEKFGFTQSEASVINSLVYTMSAVASPVLGYLVDKLGRNLLWCLVSVVGTLAAHALLAYTFLNPYVAIVIMGISYSAMACALWPMVAYIVPESQLGTAYGFMQAIQNLGLAVISMVAGMIVDEKGYLWLEVFMCACVSVALMCNIILYVNDWAENGPLNLSAPERQRREDEEEAALEAKGALASQASSVTPTASPDRNIRPRSAAQLRHNFLTRLGVPRSSYREHVMRVHSGPGVLK